jgi:hypothetical protein
VPGALRPSNGKRRASAAANRGRSADARRRRPSHDHSARCRLRSHDHSALRRRPLSSCLPAAVSPQIRVFVVSQIRVVAVPQIRVFVVPKIRVFLCVLCVLCVKNVLACRRRPNRTSPCRRRLNAQGPFARRAPKAFRTSGRTLGGRLRHNPAQDALRTLQPPRAQKTPAAQASR